MLGQHDSQLYSDLVIGALRRFRERVAFRYEARDFTYAHVADRLGRCVRLLHERGFRAGDGLGILAPNRPEVWIGQTAAPLAGGRFTALHPLGSFDDHRYACDEAELRFLFVDPNYADRAGELLDKCPSVEAVFTFGRAGVGQDLNALLDTTASSALAPGPHRPEDVAWLLYTGGTTGVPKAAMLPERAVHQMAMSVATGWDLPRQRRYLACAPISHAAGMLVTPTLMAGGTVILQSKFDPGAWLAAVQEERATLALLVPTMIYAVLDHPDLASTDLSSIETIMYGASPISPARLIEGMDRIGQVFCQLYGQTECTGLATSLWRHQHLREERRLASCGTAIPGVRVAVLDEDGHEMPDGAAGEICVQGPSVMLGYFKQPALTASTLRDGWLRTGDMAVRDGDGYFTIVDRKKDMIVSGGFNVFPREIEDVLSSHPSVSAVAVIGVPDDKWGEAVKALVVARPGAVVDGDELVALVRDKKGPVYAPKSVDVVDALPLTAVGKADKKALRARYWEGHDRHVH
jgi:fatty-acyl-CoA synthase